MNAVLGRYAISRRNRQDSSPERRFGEGPVQGHLTQAVRGRNHVERPQCVFNTEGTAGLFQLRSAVLLWWQERTAESAATTLAALDLLETEPPGPALVTLITVPLKTLT
jgi:hypothetical protein